MNNKLIFNVFFVLFILAGCQTNTEKVDSIVIAPKIYLANSSFEFAEAMAIKNGKVVATGTEKEITKNYQSENIGQLMALFTPVLSMLTPTFAAMD